MKELSTMYNLYIYIYIYILINDARTIYYIPMLSISSMKQVSLLEHSPREFDRACSNEEVIGSLLIYLIRIMHQFL